MVRDLFRKTGRPLERELDLVPVVPRAPAPLRGRRRALDLPAGDRAAQIEALDGLEAGLGARWAAWTVGFADTWEALRKDWLETPLVSRSTEHASAAPVARSRSRSTVHRAVRAFKDERLARHGLAEWLMAGQDPRNVPAWAAMSTYVEQNFGVWTVSGRAEPRSPRRSSPGLDTRGVTVHTDTEVLDLEVVDGRVRGVRTAAGTSPPTSWSCADRPAPAPRPGAVRRAARMPAIPPVICHVGIVGDVPDLPHEVVLHGDPMLVVRTGGTGRPEDPRVDRARAGAGSPRTW